MSEEKGNERTIRIPLDKDYVLVLDGLGNVYIVKKTIAKKGKNAGQPSELVIDGFHTKIEDCMASFHRKLTLEQEPKSVSALIKAEHDAEKRIREMCKPLHAELVEIRKALRGK